MQRHATDVLSLVFGLIFTAVALIGLTDLLRLTEADVRWAGPGLLVLLGIVLVVSAGRRRSSPNGRDPEPADVPAPDVPASDVPASDGSATGERSDARVVGASGADVTTDDEVEDLDER